MASLFLLSASVDPLLGRVDSSSLSQQTLMELLIANIEDRERFPLVLDTSVDALTWRGVTANAIAEITEIQWSYLSLLGTIDFAWIPPTVKLFVLGEIASRGPLTWEFSPVDSVNLTFPTIR